MILGPRNEHEMKKGANSSNFSPIRVNFDFFLPNCGLYNMNCSTHEHSRKDSANINLIFIIIIIYHWPCIEHFHEKY